MVARNWIDILPDAARSDLDAVMRSRMFESREIIFNRSEQPRGLYLIFSGSALFLLEGADGKSLLLKIIRERELFGETVAFDGQPAPISIQARTRLETGFVSSIDLGRLRQKHIEIERGLASAAVQNLRSTLSALEELTLMDLRTRAHARLAALRQGGEGTSAGAIRLQITQTEFASMLGASRQAVNAVLGEFEKFSWVRRGFRSIDCLPAMPPTPSDNS